MSFINRGQELELYCRIMSDVFNTNRLLVNFVDLQIRMTPNFPKFFLIQDGYKATLTTAAAHIPVDVHIVEAQLFIPRVYVKEKALQQQEASLSRYNALYPYIHQKVYFFTHLPNSTVFDSEILSGILPTKVTIIMIDEKSFIGDYATNPLFFHHFKVNSIQLEAGGRQIPLDALTIDWKQQQFTRAYMNLFDSLGKSGDKLILTREDFAGGAFINVFDLTPDMKSNSETSYSDPGRGALRLKMRFTEAPKQSIAILVICEHEKILQIDKDRRVSIIDVFE